jgi:hypothetical protein
MSSIKPAGGGSRVVLHTQVQAPLKFIGVCPTGHFGAAGMHFSVFPSNVKHGFGHLQIPSTQGAIAGHLSTQFPSFFSLQGSLQVHVSKGHCLSWPSGHGSKHLSPQTSLLQGSHVPVSGFKVWGGLHISTQASYVVPFITREPFLFPISEQQAHSS